MDAAETPFEFFTVASLTRIGNASAGTLAELLNGLENSSDASIFHHTFQTLGSHHFLTEGFSNDFAQWVLADANRDALAEQLAALDIRDYTSIDAAEVGAERGDGGVVADIKRGELFGEGVAIGVGENPLGEVVRKAFGEVVVTAEGLVGVMKNGGIGAMLEAVEKLRERAGRMVPDLGEIGDGEEFEWGFGGGHRSTGWTGKAEKRVSRRAEQSPRATEVGRRRAKRRKVMRREPPHCSAVSRRESPPGRKSVWRPSGKRFVRGRCHAYGTCARSAPIRRIRGPGRWRWPSDRCRKD